MDVLVAYNAAQNEMRVAHKRVREARAKLEAVSKLISDWQTAVDPLIATREPKSPVAVMEAVIRRANDGWPSGEVVHAAMTEFWVAYEKVKKLWLEIPPDFQQNLTAPDKLVFRD